MKIKLIPRHVAGTMLKVHHDTVSDLITRGLLNEYEQFGRTTTLLSEKEVLELSEKMKVW